MFVYSKCFWPEYRLLYEEAKVVYAFKAFIALAEALSTEESWVIRVTVDSSSVTDGSIEYSPHLESNKRDLLVLF